MSFEPVSGNGTRGAEFAPLWSESPPVPGSPPSAPARPASALGERLGDAAAPAAPAAGSRPMTRENVEGMSRRLDEQIGRWNEALSAISGQIESELDRCFGEVEVRLVELSVAIAEKILCGELGSNAAHLARIIEQAVSRIRGAFALVLTLHPDDKQMINDWVQSQPPERALAVREDPTMERGGFLLDADTKTYDYTLRSQLDRIQSELTRLYEGADG